MTNVYGSASAQLADWCACHDVPLHVFGWRPQYKAADLVRNATYLLRPNTYVARSPIDPARQTPSSGIARITKFALCRRRDRP